MRLSALVLVGTLVAAPALAQGGGNVGQPSRAVPQTGQTTGGPATSVPGDGGSMATGSTTSRPVGEMGMSPGAGAVDSAKGGNADQLNKGVSNTGGTAGGPGR